MSARKRARTAALRDDGPAATLAEALKETINMPLAAAEAHAFGVDLDVVEARMPRAPTGTGTGASDAAWMRAQRRWLATAATDETDKAAHQRNGWLGLLHWALGPAEDVREEVMDVLFDARRAVLGGAHAAAFEDRLVAAAAATPHQQHAAVGRIVDALVDGSDGAARMRRRVGALQYEHCSASSRGVPPLATMAAATAAELAHVDAYRNVRVDDQFWVRRVLLPLARVAIPAEWQGVGYVAARQMALLLHATNATHAAVAPPDAACRFHVSAARAGAADAPAWSPGDLVVEAGAVGRDAVGRRLRAMLRERGLVGTLSGPRREGVGLGGAFGAAVQAALAELEGALPAREAAAARPWRALCAFDCAEAARDARNAATAADVDAYRACYFGGKAPVVGLSEAFIQAMADAGAARASNCGLAAMGT